VGYTHAQAYKTLSESKFVAVYSRDSTKAASLAEEFGVKAYVDLESMLQDPAVGVVSICTPPHVHPELAKACANRGIHVLVEKPIAFDLKGCDEIISTADESGVKLGVISQRRFYEPVQRVKQAIDDGRIGRPVLATLVLLGWRDEAYYNMDPWRGRWDTEGGGVLLNQAVHQIDLFQWLMGPIDELFGYWANLNHPHVEVEDTALAMLRFRNGTLGMLLLSNSQKPGLYGKIHVHGETGASVGVQTDGGSSFVSGVTRAVEPPINDLWTVPGEEHLLATWQDADRSRCAAINVLTHYHKLQIQDFLRAVIEDREPSVSGREGRKPVEIATAIYRSQRDGRPVKFPLDAVIGSEGFDGRLL
jgi:UDP-N-acetyl-2-amino-2-deoxyglucuronate dehydrogenase